LYGLVKTTMVMCKVTVLLKVHMYLCRLRIAGINDFSFISSGWISIVIGCSWNCH
jgi:hypothetical protein